MFSVCARVVCVRACVVSVEGLVANDRVSLMQSGSPSRIARRTDPHPSLSSRTTEQALLCPPSHVERYQPVTASLVDGSRSISAGALGCPHRITCILTPYRISIVLSVRQRKGNGRAFYTPVVLLAHEAGGELRDFPADPHAVRLGEVHEQPVGRAGDG